MGQNLEQQFEGLLAALRSDLERVADRVRECAVSGRADDGSQLLTRCRQLRSIAERVEELRLEWAEAGALTSGSNCHSSSAFAGAAAAVVALRVLSARKLGQSADDCGRSVTFVTSATTFSNRSASVASGVKLKSPAGPRVVMP